MATTIERQEALALLESPTNLTILSLSEPILSHATNDDVERTTPDTLKADLAHYRDLFGKLRFSYVEQVTKERFLKAICAHPPELATAQQNAQLEADLRGAKAALKAKKLAMEHALAEIETMGRRLAQTYEIVKLQTTQLASLPTDIEHLEAHIAALTAAQEPDSEDPQLNLSLSATQSLLAEREAELAELDRQVAELQSALPERKRDVSRLEGELEPLQQHKKQAVEEAKEARRLRGGDGGMAKELEERGRWLKGVDTGLRAMLQV